MTRHLKDTELRTGDVLEIGVIECPDVEHAEELSLFYAHKEEHWLWQIEASLRRPMDDLETRYYVGRASGDLAGAVCAYESNGVGIFSHVYTEPRWRGRGIASRITSALMPDFAARGGRFLALGTDFGSQAYRIYERAGFKSVSPESGTMVWEARPGSFQEYFEPQQCRSVEIAWHHWPLLCALMTTEAGGIYAKNWYQRPWIWFENDFLLVMQQQARGELRGRILQGDQGRALGFAFLSLRWPGQDEWQLTIYAYPGFWDQAGLLLEDLGTLPPRTRCYADSTTERFDLLTSVGFRERARLENRWGRDKTAAMVLLVN